MTVASTDAVRGALAPQQQGQQPAQRNTIADWLDAQKPQIAKALGSKVDADRFVMFALTAVKQTPELIKCTPDSMLAALMLSAQIGLEPGPFGYVYLNPRNRRDGDGWIKEVQFSIGYKGLVALAQRSPQIRKVIGHVVYANDEFDVEYGTSERLFHRPNLTSDRGQVIGAYAVAEWVNGATSFVYLTKEDIDKRRAAAGKGGQSGPWATHYEQMARKSAVRDLANFLPLDTDVMHAVTLDDQVHTDPKAELHERQAAPFDEQAYAEGQAALEATPHGGPVPPGDTVDGVVVPSGSDGGSESPGEPPAAAKKAAGRSRAAAAPPPPDSEPGGWPDAAPIAP